MGMLGLPATAGTRFYHFGTPLGGDIERFGYADPGGIFNIYDEADPRFPWGSNRVDMVGSFDLSQAPTDSAVLRLLVTGAYRGRGRDLPGSSPVDVVIAGSGRNVSLADFYPGDAYYLETSVPVGDYSSAPYVVDIDVTGIFASLWAAGETYAAVRLGTRASTTSSASFVSFAFSPNGAVPEPSSASLLAIALVLIALLRRFR